MAQEAQEVHEMFLRFAPQACTQRFQIRLRSSAFSIRTASTIVHKEHKMFHAASPPARAPHSPSSASYPAVPNALGKIKPESPLTLQESLKRLNNDLAVLARLRPLGDGAHPTHRTEGQPNTTCCAEIEPARADKAATTPKDTRLDRSLLTALRNFANDVAGVGNGKQPRTRMTGLQGTIKKHADGIVGRANDKTFPACHHDIHTLVSETLAEVLGKLAKHPELGNVADARNEAHVCANILGALKKHFGAYLEHTASPYSTLVKQVTVDKLNAYLDQVAAALTSMKDYVARDSNATTSGKSVKPQPIEAYRAAAGIVLTALKPAFPPTVLYAPRTDHHHHPGPYDETGTESHFAPFAWHAQMHRRLKVKLTDMMAIPHRMTAASFDGRDPETLTDNVPPAYYTDRGAQTEFWSKDRTAVEAYNKLTSSQRAMLNLCCTATPVDSRRLPEIREVAHAFARNVITAQLAEGRQHIEVPFGEITGYKPAVPQEMLTGPGKAFTSQDKENMQARFVQGTTAVMCSIFEGADQAYADALKAHQAAGNNIEGIEYMTRIIYHSDALPTDAAVEDPGNRNQDGSYKEVTTARNMQDALLAVDKHLSESRFALPEGAQQPRHRVQWAHGGGASVEPHNFGALERPTVLHSLFRLAREQFSRLELTSDMSWLTATARAGNVGMASFLRKSGDTALMRIADLIECADRINNDAFMQLHAAERFFETHVARGDHSESLLLDLANVRSAQKKASRIYHTTIGALVAQLDDKHVLDRLRNYVMQGVYKAGELDEHGNKVGEDKAGLVKPGNYLGLFMQLYSEWTSNPDKLWQPPMPLVWGSDNLTPAAARSGFEKVLQYLGQHAPIEQMLAKLQPDILNVFLDGPREDRRFRGSRAPIDPTGIHDGPSPAGLNTMSEPRPVVDKLREVGAGLDAYLPWRSRTRVVRPGNADRSELDTSSEEMSPSEASHQRGDASSGVADSDRRSHTSDSNTPFRGMASATSSEVDVSRSETGSEVSDAESWHTARPEFSDTESWYSAHSQISDLSGDGSSSDRVSQAGPDVTPEAETAERVGRQELFGPDSPETGSASIAEILAPMLR